HARVDEAGELDELRIDVLFPRLPREVERIYRHAVAAEAGTGIKGRETVRLGRAGLDHLPNVDVEGVADDLELVDERDVHAAEDVLEELGDLSRPDVGHRDQLLDDCAVEGDDGLEAVLGEAADDFGRVVDVPVSVSWVDPLG